MRSRSLRTSIFYDWYDNFKPTIENISPHAKYKLNETHRRVHTRLHITHKFPCRYGLFIELAIDMKILYLPQFFPITGTSPIINELIQHVLHKRRRFADCSRTVCPHRGISDDESHLLLFMRSEELIMYFERKSAVRFQSDARMLLTCSNSLVTHAEPRGWFSVFTDNVPMTRKINMVLVFLSALLDHLNDSFQNEYVMYDTNRIKSFFLRTF